MTSANPNDHLSPDQGNSVQQKMNNQAVYPVNERGRSVVSFVRFHPTTSGLQLDETRSGNGFKQYVYVSKAHRLPLVGFLEGLVLDDMDCVR